MPQITFKLNGEQREASYEPGMHLLEVLREECGVTSCKNGCAPEGACGCCLVMIDGRPALSCLRKPEQMAGHDITTVEGMPEETRRIISEAFVLEGGVQCGFCIPGIVVRAAALIQQGKTGDRDAIRKALDGHICRCTGYGRIVDAIQTAGEATRNGGTLPSEPRRHSFFGEEFGLHRNPQFEFLSAKGHGIGESHARVGGAQQVLGERPYVDDMKVPGMLHGAMVLSEHPRAKVLAIHTEEAAKSAGVVRILTARDVPGDRGTGLNVPDLPVFVAVGELTCCVGDFIAMVVADTQFHARQAAAKVKVDYEVLEPITDPFKALAPGAPRVHSDDTLRPAPNVLDSPTKFGRGDVEAAFATAAHVIEATFQTQAVDIAFLEPESCLAYPMEAVEGNGQRRTANGIKVHSESQGSVFDQKTIAKVLNIPEADVEIQLAASGGAFGAKEELSIQAQTAIAARLLGRPVKTTLTREQSTQHHVKRHPMTIALKVGADAEGHLLAVQARIVGDAGGYAGTSAKCLLRAACHSCGPYRVPNVDVESVAVYTNNPTSGAMRGFGTNQAHFAIEGVMDILAGRVGVDGWEIRSRNILNPGDRFATGQVMRESVRGLRESLDAVKDIYRSAKYAGVSCGIKSTGIGNGTTEEGRVIIRVVDGDPPSRGGASAGEARIEILNGYTEMGQGLYTATMQAVCEETGLPDTIMSVRWDKELGAVCGETWASRATTLSCAAAQKAARTLAEDLKTAPLGELAGREYMGSVIYSFTTKPGTPEAQKDPTTHFTFSYATQVVILDDEGRLARVVAAHDVGRAINPRLCAEQMEGGVHMGLGYALSENFTSTNGRPDSLKMRDFGLVPAKEMPEVDIILIEVPDEVGGYGAKGVGEIGCVATASAVAAALHAYDGRRRFRLPMDDSKAAAPVLPKSRRP